MTETRTKRRYAHELYPHPENEWETRPLEVEVPYLYAQAIGWNVWGTGWFDLFPGAYEKGTPEHKLSVQCSGYRTMLLIAHRQRALQADALLQGLTGQEAWEWAEERLGVDLACWCPEGAPCHADVWLEVVNRD